MTWYWVGTWNLGPSNFTSVNSNLDFSPCGAIGGFKWIQLSSHTLTHQPLCAWLVRSVSQHVFISRFRGSFHNEILPRWHRQIENKLLVRMHTTFSAKSTSKIFTRLSSSIQRPTGTRGIAFGLPALTHSQKRPSRSHCRASIESSDYLSMCMRLYKIVRIDREPFIQN